MQGEKPVFSEEGIGPSQMVADCATKARTFFPLAQDRSQPPADEAIDVSKRRPVGVFEVSKPALQDGIEHGDDALEAAAAGAASLVPDPVPKCLSAFRAHPAPARFKNGSPGS